MRMTLTSTSKLIAALGLSLISVGFLPGCAHAPHTKEACQELDWYEMGRRDGSRGLADNSQRAVKVLCEDTDQSLSEALYQNGFDSGIAQFCTYPVAFEQGRRNQQSSSTTCPLFLRDEFVRGYNNGQKFTALQKNQKEIVRKIETIDQMLKDQSADKSIDKSTDQMRRAALSGEKIHLEQERQALEAELSQAENSKQL